MKRPSFFRTASLAVLLIVVATAAAACTSGPDPKIAGIDGRFTLILPGSDGGQLYELECDIRNEGEAGDVVVTGRVEHAESGRFRERTETVAMEAGQRQEVVIDILIGPGGLNILEGEKFDTQCRAEPASGTGD